MAYAPIHLRRIALGLCMDCEAPADGKKRCHQCYEKQRDNLRVWRASNQDKVREYTRQWQRENAEQVRAADRKRYSDDPEARQAHIRRWRKEHPERIREWRLANPDKVRVAKGNYYRRHSEYVRQFIKKWRKQNPDKVLAAQQRRRARILGTDGSHTAQQWLWRVEYYDWCCRWCGRQLTGTTLTKDHVIPVSCGGSDWASNLVPACKPCNSGKHTKRHYTPPAA